MEQVSEDWNTAVANCPMGERPTFALPTQADTIASGIGLVPTGTPDLDSVLGPETDPWPPGKRVQMIQAKKAEREDAEKEMRDTGFAPDGTPYPVVQIRRELHNLKTCKQCMVPSHLMSLNALRNQIAACVGPDTPDGHLALSEKWMQTISHEMSEVFRDLADRDLVQWDETGQIASPVQAEVEPAAEPAMGSSSNDQEALDAAIASLGTKTAAAEPVTPNLGALTPSRPPSGSCEEQKKTNHNTAGHCDWRSTRME